MASSQARRAKLRERREARARRQLLAIIIGVAVLGVLVLVILNLQQTGALTPTERPYAQGKTLGPATAPVVIEEYSDFQ